MFDSLTIARQLIEACVERGQAEVLADAIRQAAEHGEYVTPGTLRESHHVERCDPLDPRSRFPSDVLANRRNPEVVLASLWLFADSPVLARRPRGIVA